MYGPDDEAICYPSEILSCVCEKGQENGWASEGGLITHILPSPVPPLIFSAWSKKTQGRGQLSGEVVSNVSFSSLMQPIEVLLAWREERQGNTLFSHSWRSGKKNTVGPAQDVLRRLMPPCRPNPSYSQLRK